VLEKLREVNPQFTLTNALTFLVIARDESSNVSQSELRREFRVVDATVSRMVRALTMEGERDKPGLGLVELEQDPNDKRRKIIRLTPKGEGLRNSILFVV
jgi:DNA-binding MarR family transcriptional regulator